MRVEVGEFAGWFCRGKLRVMGFAGECVAGRCGLCNWLKRKIGGLIFNVLR